MTSSIPNSFSSDDLQKLLKNAPVEADTECGCTEDEDPLEKMLQAYSDDLQKAMDKFSRENDIPPQLVGKALIIQTCVRLIGWHSTIATKHFEEQELTDALQWSRDAGKIQSLVCILRSIQVCPEDFLFDYE